MKRKLRAMVALLVTILGIGLVSATPAQADTSDEFPGCWQHEWGVGSGFSWSTGTGGWSGTDYAYSPKGQVPFSPDGCEDINVDCGWLSGCGEYRVRFYPSSGGSYVNSWKAPPCAQSWCAVAAATNVVNGTWFRIEYRKNGFAADNAFDLLI